MPVSKRKTHSFECVFSFLQRILGVCTVRLPCPANKNLQIVTLSISILKTLFGDYDMSMIKIEPDEKTGFLIF